MYSRKLKQKIPYTLLSVFLLALLFPNAAAAKDIAFTGMLRSYTGSRLSETDVPIAEQTVDLSLEGWGDTSAIRVNPYLYISEDGSPEIGMREAYMDFYFPSMDLRVGKQAIVWGEAEGAFITDIVSPQDLRSFILADFNEIRMGVPAVKADYFTGPFTIEAVWLPRFVPTEQPDQDSIWATPEMEKMEGAALPSADLENSEFFGKVSYFGSALNAELMAGYAWDDLPVLEGSAADPDALYKQYAVVGGSFSTTIASVVLRSEAAAYLDRSFTKVSAPFTLDTAEYDQLHGLAGLDWSLFGVDLSAQYILQYIFEYDDALMADEYDHTLTFRMRDSYLSDTLTWEFFGYFGFDPEDLSESSDALLRPSVTYSIEDGVEIQTGAEIFLGDANGKFGRYEENSMAYVSMRWYF